MASYSAFIEEVFQEINLARTKPGEYADRMEELKGNFRENYSRMRKGTVPVLTREGVAGLNDALIYLRSMRPAPPLIKSEGMRRAAQSHCNDTGPLGIVGHIGSRESTLQDRLDSFGRWCEFIGETIDYGSISAFESVSNLIIDDGLPSRPHRNLVLNPRFKKCGIGASKHAQYGAVICCVFAGDFIDREELPQVPFTDDRVDLDPDVKDWVEDALKLTCEIRTDSDGAKVTRRVKKIWEMNDGTTQTTEEITRS
jgi:hypothetical protein